MPRFGALGPDAKTNRSVEFSALAFLDLYLNPAMLALLQRLRCSGRFGIVRRDESNIGKVPPIVTRIAR
jgi:hypothetical protein